MSVTNTQETCNYCVTTECEKRLRRTVRGEMCNGHGGANRARNENAKKLRTGMNVAIGSAPGTSPEHIDTLTSDFGSLEGDRQRD